MENVTFGGFASAMRALPGFFDRAARLGHEAAAMESSTLAILYTPVDLSQARHGWAVEPTEKGAVLYNAAPHAAILEEGSRPHKPPLQPIYEWVRRVLGPNIRLQLQNKPMKPYKILDRDYVHTQATKSPKNPYKETAQPIRFRKESTLDKKFNSMVYMTAIRIRSKISIRGTPSVGMIKKNLKQMEDIDKKWVNFYLESDSI